MGASSSEGPTAPADGCWRLLDTGFARGAENMGVDRALVDSVAAGGRPILRFYRWSPACLSLGRNQPARGRYRADTIARLGLDVVRRPTGGRAVLHHHELTYSAVFPDRLLGAPRAAYGRINTALVAGVRRLGVDASVWTASARAAAPSVQPCFAEPADGEVVVDGRKLIGSAQVRIGHVILQHGSLLIEDDQPLVARLADGDSDPEGRPASLRELLGSAPGWDALTTALGDGWRARIGCLDSAATITPDETARARREAEGFADDAWTWRR